MQCSSGFSVNVGSSRNKLWTVSNFEVSPDGSVETVYNNEYDYHFNQWVNVYLLTFLLARTHIRIYTNIDNLLLPFSLLDTSIVREWFTSVTLVLIIVWPEYNHSHHPLIKMAYWASLVTLLTPNTLCIEQDLPRTLLLL